METHNFCLPYCCSLFEYLVNIKYTIHKTFGMQKPNFKKLNFIPLFNSNEIKGFNGSQNHFNYFNINLIVTTVLHNG